MIGIIVVGHIHFASGLRSAVEAIAGEQKQMAYIDFTAAMSTEQLELQIRQQLTALEAAEGSIIFTDIAGGSPCNRAMAVMASFPRVSIISGSNLPMIVNAALERDGLTLDQLTRLIIETGKASINAMTLMADNQAGSACSGITDEL